MFLVRSIEAKPGTRILAVSDIHGCADYLEGALKKVSYTTEDVLVIIGDAIEKGKESLKTARLILKLMEENPRVYMTAGNVDFDRVGKFFVDTREGNAAFVGNLKWTKKVWKRGLFLDILKELDIDIETVSEENIADIKAQIWEKYSREINLFRDRPTVLNIGDYIFVHGGIPTDDLTQLKEEDMFSYLSRDAFMQEDTAFEKNVVVGHWPVCLYRDDVDCMNPIFDYEKHKVAIDGGCALKEGAQLNVLVIPDAYADLSDVSYVAYDDLPVITAAKAQAAKERTVTIRYFDCKVELLEECDDVAKVRHVSTGREFMVPKKYLYRGDGQFANCSDFSDTYLEVAEGDALSVVLETSIGYIVKKDGVIGWYLYER